MEKNEFLLKRRGFLIKQIIGFYIFPPAFQIKMNGVF